MRKEWTVTQHPLGQTDPYFSCRVGASSEYQQFASDMTMKQLNPNRFLSSPQAEQHIYDGREYLGALGFAMDGKVEAVTAAGELLGPFDRRQAGILALLDNYRRAAE